MELDTFLREQNIRRYRRLLELLDGSHRTKNDIQVAGRRNGKNEKRESSKKTVTSWLAEQINNGSRAVMLTFA